MKKYNPIYYTKDKQVIKQFRPIIDKDGNIVNDLCISEDCNLYNWSDIQNNFYSDCRPAEVYVYTDSNGRKISPLIEPKGNLIQTCIPLHRALMILSDTEHPDWEYNDYKNLEVDHINPSIPLNNNIKNLRFVSHDDNMKAAAETGVMIKKYKKPLVESICNAICEGKSRQEIINEFSINGQLIDDIRSGRSHKIISSKYLEKGFQYQNKPRRPRSERLNEAEKICEMLSKGYSNSEICRSLNVASGLVTSVSKGISYRDISKKYGLNL